MGFFAGIASVYFAWVPIKIITSDNTQQNILQKQTSVLEILGQQNQKLDSSLIQLKNQNQKLSDQFSLLSTRYNFDSLTVDKETKKDYLSLKHALINRQQLFRMLCRRQKGKLK